MLQPEIQQTLTYIYQRKANSSQLLMHIHFFISFVWLFILDLLAELCELLYQVKNVKCLYLETTSLKAHLLSNFLRMGVNLRLVARVVRAIISGQGREVSFI